MPDESVASRLDLIEVLGVDIGTRVAGSAESARAAEAVADAMRLVGLEVSTQEFEFVGYAGEAPSLEINGEPWPAAPCLYARATAVEGVIRRIGVFDDGLAAFPVFAVERDGVVQGRLLAAPNGAGPVPLASVYGLTLAGVAAIISAEEGERLNGMDGAQVRLTTRGRVVEGLQDRNVLGLLPGESDECVIVGCHFDSVWDGPGLLDNATGVEGMLQVMERLAEVSDRPRSVLACAFAAEEIGLLGSRFFVTDAQVRGSLDQFIGVVNLDAIAHGAALEVSVAPPALERRVLQIAEELSITSRYPIVIREPLPDADDYPFAQQGIPTLSLVHFPYPEYHSTAERLELVDRERVRDTVELATHAVLELMANPVPRSIPRPIRQRLEPR